ncbi:MAG TPA: HAMP domain-containing sensor histidine kinase [Candidatus Rubrimentiphilum sp.]|nr:HAMP domain-containing sensor histidine kinase [Candidatus Rubrimentiphilum sp.]
MRRIDEIEQLKNELVSTVSHELKTPLATIKAYAATLRQNPELYADKREEYLKIVEEQADRLSRLIEDLLLVTRVEADQLLKRRATVKLDTVLREAIAEIHFDKNLHAITCETGDVSVSGDPDRLRDLFRNLVENAIKYSPAGGAIAVHARPENGGTRIEITDSGIGIAAEDLPYIFERFFRVESEMTSTVGGSGLGLYIVSAIVRAHGGTIEARSEPGRGTTFSILLPNKA